MNTIGRYRILGELGRGAMGVVYRAQDPNIGREVAIKTIRLSDFVDPGERVRLRERLFREAQSAGLLSHPGIVTIYDVAEENEIAYISMECVDGPTLDRLETLDPPDGALILSILTQTAAALDYAHKRGIVHRDIKPANIIIHDRRTAKITDFGVARIQSHQMTQVGSIVGTPNYMSPEQIQGQEVDGRSDQFSLGVIAYELLTGEKPFAADSLAALAYRIVREEQQPVHRLNPTLDWPVDTVIRRALAKNRAERYPSCSDFVFALENACRSCRKWKPLPVGASQDMATIAAPLPISRPPVPAPPPSPVPFRQDAVTAPLYTSTEPVPDEAQEEEDVPGPLRFLRKLAVVLVAGGFIVALLIGGLRFLESRREAQQAAAKSQAPAAFGEELTPKYQRPSAMGTQPAAPAPAAPKTAEQAEIPVEPKPGEPQPTKPAPKTSGVVATRLVTNPPGAFLVVDGASELSCQSPCSLDLTSGRHTLAATMAGYRRTLRILELPRDNEVFLSLDRTSGTIMVRSEPRGATIWVNGEARTEKTPAMLTLPVGKYSVDVSLNDQRESHEVQIRDSALTNLVVTFRQ